MKKRTLIVLIVSITLAIWLTALFIMRDLLIVRGLGERYDSDSVVMFPPGGTYNDNYQDELHEVYERYLKAASETQFVVHEETAIAIAEAVIEEIYPNEGYRVARMSSYQKAIYYEKENCWEVWLRKSPSRLGAILVYIDVNSGAIRAIIPQSAFGY